MIINDSKTISFYITFTILKFNFDIYVYRYGKGNIDFYDQKAIDHAIANNMKRCPSCNYWVYKVDGCDYMSCICGTGF